MGEVPDAVTLNVAVCPSVTDLFAGWVVMAGAIGCELFVSPAAPPQPERTNTITDGIQNIAGKNDFIIFHLL
jgi:hypothetical protein